MSGNDRVGIMAAMPEELEAVLELFSAREPVIHHGQRAFHRGRIGEQAVVAAYSRCGKVAAAATATELIVRFEIASLVFTGLAGGIGDGVRVGDLVVPESLVQHDLDASPLFPRFEVPLTGIATFTTDASWCARLADAAKERVNGTDRRVHHGLLATGDQFIGSETQRQAVRAALPGVVAVDMEAAAVAQVAADYGVPLAVVRLISDSADREAGEAFSESLARHAGACARAIFSHVFA